MGANSMHATKLSFISEPVLGISDNLLELDIGADPKFAGWSPGCTSLTNFARELTFWRKFGTGANVTERTWMRATSPPSLTTDFVVQRGNAMTQSGLGKDWTEKRGYEQVRELVGLSK